MANTAAATVGTTGASGKRVATTTFRFGPLMSSQNVKRGNSDYDAFHSHELQVAFGNIVALYTLK